MPTPTHFPHERLEAWQTAMRFAELTIPLMSDLPRGYAHLGDQARRAATSTVLLIAEGANRVAKGDKRHRYSLAHGECGEAASALQLAAHLGIIDETRAAEAIQTADRVGAMLAKLVQRHR